MIWQDVVIMAACFGLGAAAIPSIFSKQKPNRPFCLMFGLLVLTLAITFATMKLWLSTAAEAFAALPMFIMLFQRRK